MVNKKVGIAQDVLDAIGHENEKEGIRWTKHFMDLWEKDQSEDKFNKESKLKKSEGYDKLRYNSLICNMLQEEINGLDLDVGYSSYARYTKDGVFVILKAPNKKVYGRGFKPSHDYKVDYTAVVGLLVDILDTVDYFAYEKKNNLEKQGIIIDV
jgi:hypothetical protein